MRRAFWGAMALVATMMLAETAAAANTDWYIRRNASNQMCSIQRGDTQPLLGRYFSEHDSRKEACEFARARYSKPARDVDQCPGYARGTVEICRIDGVKLPE